MRIAIMVQARSGAALRGDWPGGPCSDAGCGVTRRRQGAGTGAGRGGGAGPAGGGGCGADLVILALPWAAAEGVVAALGDLTGKVVIDCMNPIGMVDGAPGLLLGHATSGAEVVQGWLPGARVVKTLNQVGAEIMADTARLPHRPVMFMAGNDAGQRRCGGGADRSGLEGAGCGRSVKRGIGPFAMVWINQAMLRGKGRAWAFAAVAAA